jgi:hypothetical protein
VQLDGRRPARDTRVRRARVAGVAIATVAPLLASGCGAARQDAHEPSGAFALEVVHASFPPRQVIARPTTFELAVRNSGSHGVPDIAVTVDSFGYTSTYPELAAAKRPVWVIEEGPASNPRAPVESQEVSQPGGAQTAYVNTWALGGLPAGQTRTFRWRVTPVKAGSYTVHYRFAAGLAGKAVAKLSGGGPVQGQLLASIAPAPPTTHVDPNTGKVVVGGAPPVGAP